MYCTKCGTQIDGKFCYICGTKIDDADNVANAKTAKDNSDVSANVTSSITKIDEDNPDNTSTNGQTTDKSARDTTSTMPTAGGAVNAESNAEDDAEGTTPDENDLEGKAYLKSKLKEIVALLKKPKVLLITIGAFLAIVIVSLLIIFYKPSIKLDKYVQCKFSGYDLVGSAKIVFDYDAFNEEYKETIAKHIDESELKKKFETENKDSDKDTAAEVEFLKFKEDCARELLRYIAGSLDKTEYLSNGDEIVYEWKIDEEFIDDCFDIKLKYDEDGIKFEVEGLKEVSSFNPFEGVELVFKGVAPEGRASFKFNNNIPELYALNYALDVSEDLSNGDVITATVTISGSPTNFVEEFGRAPSPCTKSFTVNSLENVVESMNNAPKALIDEIDRKAVKRINDDMMAYLPGNQQVVDVAYLGNVFLNKKKDSDSDGSKTICFMVYELTISSSLKTDEEGWVKDESKVYTYVQFNDLSYKDNGGIQISVGETKVPNETFEIDSKYKDPDRWFGGKYELKFKGYEKAESIYDNVIKAFYDDYDYEENLNK
ncbi:MAG: hypothetical protein MJ133_04385 [Lachnospiraceae bacterium]|nr:hypothetical protein [Lachnospiraceae bacterium]